MLEILIWFSLGIVLGIIAGLLPGLHTNTLIFLSIPLYFSLGLDITIFITFVIAISVTNTFVDFIPSIFLGAPESDTALSVLPGHKFTLKGRGYEAIKLTVFGGVSSSVFSLLLLPALFLLIPAVYPLIENYMHILLSGLLVIMLVRDKQKKYPLIVIALSGTLGTIVLNSNMLNSQFILLPVFTGLFGIPTLLISILQKVEVPEQSEEGRIKDKDWSAGFKGFIAGVLAGVFPGLGSSQSILLLKESSDMKIRDFITAQGGVNTSAMLFSLLSLYLIGKARSGAAIAIQRLITSFDMSNVIFTVGISLVTISIAALSSLIIGKKVSKIINQIEYRKILLVVLIFLFGIVLYLTGFLGILIMLTSTSIGFYAVLSSTKRSYCMSVLIVPTILYYAGFSAFLSSLI